MIEEEPMKGKNVVVCYGQVFKHETVTDVLDVVG